MKDNPLKELAALGQSIWLDYIRRNLIVKGVRELLEPKEGRRTITWKSA